MNAIAAIAGSFIGLLLGGVLAPHNWRLVFLVSVPFGVFGTVWAYFMLHDQGIRRRAKMDWWGNLLFAAGLILILVGITYGLLPYGGHPMGWTNPRCWPSCSAASACLVIFVIVETKVAEPLFHLSLFRIRAFAAGNLANLLVALGRGGIQFILIIWLQGIWLPLHGYDFAVTPLWAGIYMVPLTVGFLVSAPLSGIISDRFGARVLHRGRRAADGGELHLPVLHPGELQVRGVRRGAGDQRVRIRAVRPAQPGRDHELGARQPARRRGRDDRDLPEHRVRAVDRRLLLADRHRPGQLAAVGDVSAG